MERRVLELVIRRCLVNHPYPPKGFRYVEAGDVVAESSFEGTLNGVFRTSGFSLLSNGTWTEYPWESLGTPLDPIHSMSDAALRIPLKSGEILEFPMDHFGGYWDVFGIIDQWFKTDGKGGWWRRIVEEGVLK